MTIFIIYPLNLRLILQMPNTDPLFPRAYHGTVVVGTKIYLIGGYDGSESHNSCRSFDVVTKVWSDVAPMFYKRFDIDFHMASTSHSNNHCIFHYKKREKYVHT